MSELDSILHEVLLCQCEEKYTVEPHGDGYAIYFGRCDHKHGANVGHLTECRKDFPKWLENKLNGKLILSEKLAEACQEHLLPSCTCHEAYTSRKKIDPSCEYCNTGQYILPIANQIAHDSE